MTETGPQRYPGASTAHWYQAAYNGTPMETNVIVWHSTEGTSLPSYSGGAQAPNFTAVPNFTAERLVWYQHFDFDVSSRALVNAAGGVETNTLNVCQVEIVGTCDPSTHSKWTTAGYRHLYTPELPAWAIRDLGAFAKWAHDQHGVPLSSGLTFKAYPSSYGASNGVRMSGTQWNSFSGHCGHQHVPENLHGDPGAFPIAAILAAAKNGTTEENDVALTDADIEKIARRVLTLDGVIVNPVPGSTNTHVTLATSASTVEKLLRRTEGKVDALPAVELTDVQIATLASAVASNAALAELIAEKVAQKLAARLAD